MINLILGILVILIILGICFKSSKTIFIINMVVMWTLLAFMSGGSDWDVHLSIFNDPFGFSINSLFSGGQLYRFIAHIFKLNNLTFIDFNIFLYSIAMIFLYRYIKKRTNNCAFVSSLIMIYPLTEMIIQKRNFFGSLIILLAIDYLFSDKKKDKIIFVLLCLLAAQIHVSMLAYILLIFLFKSDRGEMKKRIKYFLLVGYLLIPIIPQLAVNFFPASKVQLYFFDLQISLFDTICWSLLHIASVYLVNKISNKIIPQVDDEKKKYITNIANLNLCSLIFLPLYYYECTFIRFYRNLFILNYILVSYAFMKNIRKDKNLFYIIVLYVVYIIFAFLLIYVLTGKGFEEFILNQLFNNDFIKWIIGGM